MPPHTAPLGPTRATAAVVAAALLAPSALGAQGLTVRVAPEASATRWEEEVGIEDATFLGGGLSLGFGRYVTLRGSYRTAGTVGTAFSASGYRPFDSSLRENRVRASLYSSGVLFRLGAGRVAPVLAADGGVLELEPEGRDRIRQIQVGYGGGLDLRLTPWLDGQVLVENVRLRLDRSLLAPADALPAEDPERGVTRSALGLSASFGLRAGGGRSSARADEVDQGFGRLLSGDTEGLMVPVEAQVGVLRFDDALGLDDQPTVGLRTGLDLGPYFGVRGQLFQGVTDGFDSFRGVWGWTGELQLNVGKVTGASPHLLVGLGQTRFDDEYREETGKALEDQNALVLGAGLGIPLDHRTRITLALRDHITTSGAFDETSSTSDLRHNLSLTGGISVILFGRPEARPAPVADMAGSEDGGDYRSGRLLAIPVPKEGEVYVRYGPGGRTLPVGGGVDSAAVGAAVQEELIRMVGEGGAALSDSARAALQARVLGRLQALTVPVATDSAAVAGAIPGAAPSAVAAGAAPGAEPSVAELRRQVEELTRLIRESMILQGAATLVGGRGTTVNVLPGAPGTGLGDPASEPFLRAVDARLGRSAMGDGSGGIALHADAHLGRLRNDDNLIPFVSLEVARQGIRTDVGGRAAEGSATTLGAGFGVTAVLPHLGPVWPTASVLLAAANVGTSADRPADEAVVDDEFGGLSVGPGFQLGAAYRPDSTSRTFVTAALRKIWAGGTSRWSVQAGVRIVFPPRTGSRAGPFSMPLAATPSPAGTVADTLARPGAAVVPDSAAAAGPMIHPTPTVAAAADLLARVEALEARLRQEAEARVRAEEEARALRLRADSLAVAAQSAAAVQERVGADEQIRRDALMEALRARAAGAPALVSVEAADGLVRIVLGGTLFPVGATAVAPPPAAEVRALGAILAGSPDLGISVEGHTDDTGTEEANLTISRLRAESVRRLLVEGGVPDGTVTATGRGESTPLADNDTREGRARNRRVEVSVRLTPAGT
ncbi:MAG: OmpA family protein [Longimicrobiales bacterium]